MIALKGIGAASFTPTKQPFLRTKRLATPRSYSLLCLSKSGDSDTDSTSESSEGGGGGDTRRQELLARIAMLQTEKVRLTDYLDERSDYLTQFAEEANAEIDKIGEDALTRLDEASSRIMEKIESRMQAFEESAEMEKAEIEDKESKLADFEGQMDKDRNEGLFFENLGMMGQKAAPAVDKTKAQEEVQKIKDLAKAKAESAARKNIYLALIAILVFTIAESVITTPSPEWRKIAVLGAILVGLITQVTYEQSLSSSSDAQNLEQKDKADKEEQ
ncbi:unnamed protein product [Linum tenue]|uniref:Uncharacterized protein n=1 Tax=Linum tenue TaxID=586396 RepID=A0AAV0KS78_9ROSI|nr:unnamed protein product [Linum tenue]